MHDVDIEGSNLHSDEGARLLAACRMDHPFVAMRIDDHLKVDALEDHRLDNAGDRRVLRFDDFDILRPDDYVDTFKRAKSTVNTVKFANSTRQSLCMTPSMMLLSPIKSATNAFFGSL